MTAEQARVTAIYTGRGLEEQVLAAAAEELGPQIQNYVTDRVTVDVFQWPDMRCPRLQILSAVER